MPTSKNGTPYYTDAQYEIARYQSSALEYARATGYHLEQKGGWWTMKEHDSFVFAPNGMWFWNSHDMKGGAIEFLTQIEHKSLVEAVLTLAGERVAEIERNVKASMPVSAKIEAPFYGKIDYYGDSGTVVDDIYLNDRPTYLREISDAQNVGRTIVFRKITQEEFTDAMKNGRTVYRYSNSQVFDLCETKFKHMEQLVAKLNNPALSKIHDAQKEGIKDDITYILDFEKAYNINDGFTNVIYESYDYLFDELKESTDNDNINSKKPFELPPKADNFKRLFAYLCGTRCLDKEIVQNLVKQGKIYESSRDYTKDGESKSLHNAVFIGFDKDGQARSGFQRGLITNTENPFKRDVIGSEKEYAFCVDGENNVDTVAVFEASIDAVSHASIEKISVRDYKAIDRIALGGIAFKPLQHYLDEHPHIKKVIICVDADEAGDKAAESLKTELINAGYTPDNGYHCERQIPTGHKDFNEYLISYREALAEQHQNVNSKVEEAPEEHSSDGFFSEEGEEHER